MYLLDFGLCGVKIEQIVKEWEDGEKFKIYDIDRILALATPDLKTLVSSVADARWLLKQEFTDPYNASVKENLL